MIGAILGDIIGSPFEFDMGDKSKDFPLFSNKSRFTDDTVMSLAVAKAFMDAGKNADDEAVKANMISSMRELASRYPHAGYGTRFIRWLCENDPKPYGSYGNGSAMRVSSAAWLFDDIDSVSRAAYLSACVSHDHPEGIKGAQATAGVIFLARKGWTKEQIKQYITENYGYDLNRTCDEIRPSYRHVESCQQTVPEAITAFMEGDSFVDVVRTAVSLGGDCDTLTCIAGSMAEAYYGVPEELAFSALKYLTPDLRDIYKRFLEYIA